MQLLPGIEKGGLSMERLTRRWGPEEKQISGHAICEFNHCPEDTTCASCVYGQKNNRLADIEDILGSEYDLDHLKQIIEADREGRCVIAEKPPESGNKYVLQTVQGCWINGDVTILKQSALKAMKEREDT